MVSLVSLHKMKMSVLSNLKHFTNYYITSYFSTLVLHVFTIKHYTNEHFITYLRSLGAL
jgi:hypothetical protein